VRGDFREVVGASEGDGLGVPAPDVPAHEVEEVDVSGVDAEQAVREHHLLRVRRIPGRGCRTTTRVSVAPLEVDQNLVVAAQGLVDGVKDSRDDGLLVERAVAPRAAEVGPDQCGGPFPEGRREARAGRGHRHPVGRHPLGQRVRVKRVLTP